jgi:adhesin transport system outer membrane protein
MFTVSVASLSSVTFAASGNVATTNQAEPIVGQVVTTAIPSIEVAIAEIMTAQSVLVPNLAVEPVIEIGAPAAGDAEFVTMSQFAETDVAPSTVATALALQATMTDNSGVLTLDQAIAAALETSPEINQAIMNKEAIEFEREQAQGLYLPRVDIEASAGIRRLENPTRRTLGIEDDTLYPLEAGITAEQTLIDFGRRRGELTRQAARTDGAALRVAERSENIALLVTRQYLDILLQQRISAASDDNVTFHQNLVGDLGQGVQQGSISIADQQQAQERLQAAIVRKAEAEEALVNAQIKLQTLTGLTVTGASMPQSLRTAITPTLGEAVAEARQNNPRVKEAAADVDAAHAMASKAKGDLYPTIGVDARGRVGEDIDGFAGKTNDVQARVFLRWNIFDGGINRAKYQEMVRRASEARFRLHELGRFAEEDVRSAWNSMSTQRKVGEELSTQSKVSDDLLLSYREQFNVGRRSLLDVLDAQNTRYNVQVRLDTARFAEQFAEYRVLASTNKLLASMNMAAPQGAEASARARFDYGPPAPAELQRRRYPR